MSRKYDRKQRLRAHIEACMAGAAESVPLADFTHDLIAEVLNDLAYSQELQERHLPIFFRDQTDLAYFPLGRLVGRPLPDESQARRVVVGTVSLRHHELDYICNTFLVLNSEVSGRGLSQAQTAIFSYNRAYSALKAFATSGSRIWLRLIQTGLQPAVIGIYQALEQILFEYPGSLVVEPLILRGGSDRQEGDDTLLDKTSYGAQLPHYRSLNLWY